MAASFAAIITAAGSSTRMRSFAASSTTEVPGKDPVKKEYLPLGPDRCDGEGKPLTVLGAAVLAFTGFDEIGLIVVTVPADGEAAARAALPRGLREPPLRSRVPPILFTCGGPSRRESVYRALSFLRSGEFSDPAPAWAPQWVLIHDGARPWVSAELIRRVMDAVIRHDAVIPLVPLLETPKELGEGGFILRHLRRSRLGLAQTPQAFAFPRILHAHEWAAHEWAAHERAGDYTDDAEIWGEFCGPVATVPGERDNRKITYAEDLCNRLLP
ncbi:MAG: 2-C-methyl-D-erythritol 4-phosphate cytidylyltransferase [Treponema sp.]|jgi:2-C-methyl-D-erythritol 4-phosphate cytidylyltransferase/2-C-methyl-D-erythritol 4-phosphate cytidylyltransferase/2-C-methyl-D-erythritol 2,4-cyclodiphosphate synthase|nr:2-C-methyl-D-erythritol 4-phosphate cytidylyltransferase [Treponema sp.]